MHRPSAVPASVVGQAGSESPIFQCAFGERNEDSACIRVAGELDIATSPQLAQTLSEAALGARQIVLDLRQLTFMDCSGIRVLVDASHHASRSGGRLKLIRGPSPADRVFVLTNVGGTLELVDPDPPDPSAAQGVPRSPSDRAA